MKIHRILCLGAAIVIPQLALAKLPFTNDAFGKIEGTLDFCAQVDPQTAAKYQEQKQQIVRDVPDKELVKARQTQEYKDAYEGISAELGKVSKDQAIKACTEFLEGR